MKLSRQEAEALLEAFGSAHGIALGLDGGEAVAEFGDGHALIFEFSEGRLCVWSPVANLDMAQSAQAEAALLKFLLAENFPFAHLGGARIALDPDSGTLLMASALPLESADPTELAALLEAFVDRLLAFVEQVGATDWENPLGVSLRLPDDGAAGNPSLRV